MKTRALVITLILVVAVPGLAEAKGKGKSKNVPAKCKSQKCKAKSKAKRKKTQPKKGKSRKVSLAGTLDYKKVVREKLNEAYLSFTRVVGGEGCGLDNYLTATKTKK